jgi:hypothetical protein
MTWIASGTAMTSAVMGGTAATAGGLGALGTMGALGGTMAGTVGAAGAGAAGAVGAGVGGGALTGVAAELGGGAAAAAGGAGAANTAATANALGAIQGGTTGSLTAPTGYDAILTPLQAQGSATPGLGAPNPAGVAGPGGPAAPTTATGAPGTPTGATPNGPTQLEQSMAQAKTGQGGFNPEAKPDAVAPGGNPSRPGLTKEQTQLLSQMVKGTNSGQSQPKTVHASNAPAPAHVQMKMNDLSAGQVSSAQRPSLAQLIYGRR